MPIFCLDYAQIGTPFGEKSHNGTLVLNTAILHKSYDTSGWEKHLQKSLENASASKR